MNFMLYMKINKKLNSKKSKYLLIIKFNFMKELVSQKSGKTFAGIDAYAWNKFILLAIH